MITPSHPPRPGVRRLILETTLDNPQKLETFRAVVAAIQKSGLIAEATQEGAWTHVHATRRSRTARIEK